MLYTIRQLTTAADTLAFQQGYATNLAERSKGTIKLELPLDYLATSTSVMGVFDKRSQLVGGYVVRRDPPFRCLRSIPDEVKRESPLLRTVPEAALCELTCIWRNKGISPTRFGTRVWPRIILDCVRVRRRYILGLGFENRMNDRYQVWSPTKIYRGPSAAGEVSSSPTVHIFVFSRPRIVANFVTNFVLQMPVRAFHELRRRGR